MRRRRLNKIIQYCTDHIKEIYLSNQRIETSFTAQGSELMEDDPVQKKTLGLRTIAAKKATGQKLSRLETNIKQAYDQDARKRKLHELRLIQAIDIDIPVDDMPAQYLYSMLTEEKLEQFRDNDPLFKIFIDEFNKKALAQQEQEFASTGRKTRTTLFASELIERELQLGEKQPYDKLQQRLQQLHEKDGELDRIQFLFPLSKEARKLDKEISQETKKLEHDTMARA